MNIQIDIDACVNTLISLAKEQSTEEDFIFQHFDEIYTQLTNSFTYIVLDARLKDKIFNKISAGQDTHITSTQT